MSATVATVGTDVTAVQGIAQTILDTIEAVDPAVGATVEEAANIVNLLAGLVTAALTALQNATGTPITVESVTALLPNPTPLPEPPAGQ